LRKCPVRTIQTSLKAVECLAISPDGRRLAAAGYADLGDREEIAPPTNRGNSASTRSWVAEVWDLTTA
jgi:hypothetical protein